MKKNYLCISMAAALLVTACSDELEEDKGSNSVAAGDEIVFGASGMLSFGEGLYDNMGEKMKPGSRTIYGDAYFDGTRWHYPVSWVHGDSVWLYSPQATTKEGSHHAEYEIRWEGGTDGDVGQSDTPEYLIKVGDEGLQWANTNVHDFYAFYPSCIEGFTFTENNNDLKVEGEIPAFQKIVRIEEREDGRKVAIPDMHYAFMRAVSQQVLPGKVIPLTFEPITTAVDITVTAGKDPVQLTTLQVESVQYDENHKVVPGTQFPIWGDFTYSVKNGAVTLDNTTANNYQVTVSVWDGTNPVKLNPGQSITVTAFLLPGMEGNPDRTVHNLAVRVNAWNLKPKVKYYNGVNIPIRTRSQIILPAIEMSGDKPDYDVNIWMKSVPDPTYVSQLTIPGSVNAFSGPDYFELSADKYEPGRETIRAQMLSVEDQFKKGVRAFDFAVETPNPYSDEESDASLGNASLIVGGDISWGEGLTFDDALKKLAALVQSNPSEFIVVMPFYNSAETRKDKSWCMGLKTYLQSLGGTINGVRIQPYRSNITVGEARGSILFLSRMPGDKSTVTGWVGEPQYTTAVYGWDADKDRWERRGYDMSKSGFWWNASQDGFVSWTCWNGNSDPSAAKLYPGNDVPLDNWKYEAASTVVEPVFYVQDWYRVCAETKRYHGDQWYESMSEKKKHVEDFMDESISRLRGNTSGDIAFINSLGGGYVSTGNYGSTSSAVSHIPYPQGKDEKTFAKHRGDVPQFARDINEMFYQRLVKFNYENRGPLGIVLMNFAGLETVYNNIPVHGEYILHSLIDNNFSFPLTGNTAQGSK